MNTKTTLPTALLQFLFTGVMAPHKRYDYEAPRVVSQDAHRRAN